jgi:hypothetical protein
MRCLPLIGLTLWLLPASVGAQLRVQVDRSGEAERSAREIVQRFYGFGRSLPEGTIPGDVRFAADQGGWPSSCVGTSLAECFGGDPDCRAVGFDLPSYSDHFKLCNDPSVPPLRAWILSALDSLATIAPMSDWIAGQRVSFAIKSGELEHAAASADACRATLWWCQALRGYALHQIRAGSGAARFDSALVSAPAGTAAWETPTMPSAGDRGLRCEWADLSLLISDIALRSDYQARPCGEVGEFDRRFWWLADPLWSTPANERRDEHLARNVQARLRDQVLRATHSLPAPTGPGRVGDPRGDSYAQTMPEKNLEGITIRSDLDSGHRTLIPAGPPNSWRGISWSRKSSSGEIEHHTPSGVRAESLSNGQLRCCPGQARQGFVNGGYSFVPDVIRFRDPIASTAADWALTWNEGHERMVTREKWYDVEEQTAVLRRGGVLLTLSAARLPLVVHSFDGIDAALAMGRPSDLRVEASKGTVDALGVVRASVSLPEGEWLASVEVSGDGWRGRARHGAPAPVLERGFGVSSPLLIANAESRRASTSAADDPPDDRALLQTMLPDIQLEGGRAVGLYFEVYGAARSEMLSFTVHVEAVKVERSIFGRLGRALGLGSGDGLAKVTWSEAATVDDQRLTRQAIDLAIPDLGAGDYRVVIEVRRPDGQTATGRRTLRVE